MLRITAKPTENGNGQLLRLEGKLLSTWVQELQKCLSTHTEQTPLALDLSALSFADQAGLALLRDALSRGVRLVACTGYLQTLLRSNTTCQR
jgi:anti-anti-sigma regulatory factor